MVVDVVVAVVVVMVVVVVVVVGGAVVSSESLHPVKARATAIRMTCFLSDMS